MTAKRRSVMVEGEAKIQNIQIEEEKRQGKRKENKSELALR